MRSKIIFSILTITLIASVCLAKGVDDEFTTALAYFNNGKYTHAIQIFQKIISSYEKTGDIENPKYVVCRFYRGKCFVQTGDNLKALDDFIFVDSKKLTGYEVWLDIVQIYLGESEHERAVVFLKKKIDKEPNSAYFIELGRIYWNLGKTELAIDSFEKSRALDKSNTRVLYYLTNLYWETDNWKRAVESASALEKISNDPYLKELAKGFKLIAIGLYEKAELDFETLLKSNPDDNTVKLLQVECLMRSSRLDEAEKLIGELILSNRQDSYYWFKASEIAIIRKNADSARKLYESMDVRIREYPFGALLNAFALVREGKSSDADSLLTRQRERNFSKADFYSPLAALLHMEKNTEGIENLLKRYNENIGDGFPIDDSLFWLIAFKDPTITNEEVLDLAQILNAQTPETSSAWAFVKYYEYTGELDKILNWADKAIESDPENVEYPFLAAIICLRQGDRQKADAYWKKVSLKASNDDDWRNVAKELEILLKQ